MNELQAVLDAWEDAVKLDQSAVLATVVHVEGSAYRRPGARMLLLTDGTRVGSVSGGCLEQDVCRKAWWLTGGGKPSVQVYDTHSDDDAVWEFGLGCNGVVHVLLERLDSPGADAAMEFIGRTQQERGEAVTIIAISVAPGSTVSVGDRYWLGDSGQAGGELSGTALAPDLRTLAHSVQLDRKSCLAHLPEGDFFVEWIGPPLPLVIFGAGHDVIPLANLAKQMGWHVTVVDTRAGYANPERFPTADRIVLTGLEDPIGDVEIDTHTAVVVMTHSYPLDENLVPRLAALRPSYLGLLGARSRTERLLAGLGDLADEVRAYGPVGLDIGADTPESVALAVVAEIHAVLAGRCGGPLSASVAPMHDAVIEIGERASRDVHLASNVECGIGK